jgi:hypothetical protein
MPPPRAASSRSRRSVPPPRRPERSEVSRGRAAPAAGALRSACERPPALALTYRPPRASCVIGWRLIVTALGARRAALCADRASRRPRQCPLPPWPGSTRCATPRPQTAAETAHLRGDGADGATRGAARAIGARKPAHFRGFSRRRSAAPKMLQISASNSARTWPHLLPPRPPRRRRKAEGGGGSGVRAEAQGPICRRG